MLIAFNAPSLTKFGPEVRKGGTVIYDCFVVTEAPDLDPSIKVFPVPFTGIATDLVLDDLAARARSRPGLRPQRPEP